ncbi:MAG: ubiquinone biosynthesis protein [Caulobacteraceae bacterium]|nr:ubiquinone biosynthesis protein [Caulobacteraceae bacterium]
MSNVLPLPMDRLNPASDKRYRLQPLRALQALMRLIANKDDTRQAFVILQALGGRSLEHGYRRMLAFPAGLTEAREGRELIDSFCRWSWLDQFAPGTVGAAYREFLLRQGYQPDGLSDFTRAVADIRIEDAHPYAWYGRRLRDSHDVWHVLTGYGPDTLGEVCLAAFSYAQTGMMGLGLIAIGALPRFKNARNGQPYGRSVIEAYRAGRTSGWLPAENYETLFAEPLERARARLGIVPPDTYASVPLAERDGPFAKAA